MTRLYDIQQQIYDLLDEIALAEGEITPEQEARLEGLHASRDQKLRNYCRYFRNLDSDVDEIDYEIKRLQARKKSMLNGKERLLDHAGKMLGESGRFADAAVGELKWSKPTGKVELTGSIIDIPPKYLKATWSVKTGEVNDALQNGEEVPGARLVFEKKMRFVAAFPKAKAANENGD